MTKAFLRQANVDSDFRQSGWLSIEETVERIFRLIALFGL